LIDRTRFAVMVDLHGKVALVTGSSSGIGEAIARGVAARGAKVVVNSTSSVAAGERVAGELPDATYVQADIADPNYAARLVRAAVPHLRATGDGVIVNITSLAGVRPVGSSIPYATSKAALNHLTVLLANALGPDVRVNALAPGLIDTPWTEGWDDIRAAVQQMAPLRRSGTPDDVADACLGLVDARYTTGQVVLVDGGMALR
jgi:ketoreductase RED2